MENNGFVLLNETEYKQLNLPGSMGNFEHLYNFMTNELKSNNYLLKKIGNSAQLSTEEKQISFLNNYFIFKKIRNVEYEPEKLVSKKQELKEKELEDEIIGEFKKIDEEFEVKEKEKIDEKSKKLASQYIKETQDLEQQLEEQLEQQQSKASESKAVNKTKLSIDEKIKLAEEKKKAKEEEKLKTAQEKKAAKEAEKSLKAETKKSQKTQTKKA
jgi:superfamily II DNA/RNA helicase